MTAPHRWQITTPPAAAGRDRRVSCYLFRGTHRAWPVPASWRCDGLATTSASGGGQAGRRGDCCFSSGILYRGRLAYTTCYLFDKPIRRGPSGPPTAAHAAPRWPVRAYSGARTTERFGTRVRGCQCTEVGASIRQQLQPRSLGRSRRCRTVPTDHAALRSARYCSRASGSRAARSAASCMTRL